MKKVSPHICQTASGALIVDGRILLIKHKKMGSWMTPGGHVEKGEFLHQAAEREFFEETGLRVQAVSQSSCDLAINSKIHAKQFHPVPIAINHHWISQENYQARVAGRLSTDKIWSNGCEQHLDFKYLVKAAKGLNFKQNTEETDGIAWFTLDQVKAMSDQDIFFNMRAEVILAFKLINS